MGDEVSNSLAWKEVEPPKRPASNSSPRVADRAVPASERTGVGVIAETHDPLLSSRLHAAALAQINDAVVIIEQNYNVVYWGPGAEKLYQLPADEALGRALQDCYTYVWDSPEQEADAYHQLSIQGSWRGEVTHLTRGGDRIRVEAVVTRYLGMEREELGLIAVMRDVTERRTAEEALHRSMAEVESARRQAETEKRRLEAVMEALPVGVAITDEHGEVVRFNRAYDRLWRSQDSGAKSPRQPESHHAKWEESGQALGPNDWASMQALRTGDAVVGQLLEVQRIDGSYISVINSAAPVRDADGRVIGSAVAIQDVTEFRRAQRALRDSERIYRAIGESIDFGVWVCEPDGRNIYASKSFLDLVGLTQEECSSFGWGRVLHPDDAERTIAAWKACVRNEGTWDIEHRFMGVDGQTHPILARGVPVRDEAGALVCWAGINLDIHRWKETEATLRRHEQELKEADRRKNEFLAMLSHELRNPLTPIRNSLFLLEHAPQGSEQSRRALKIIDRQVGLLTRLVDDLLDVTRITRGKIQLQRERLDLVSLLQKIAEDHRFECTEAGLDLVLSLPAEPEWVQADPARISQAVGNLLQNATKFGRPGGRVVLALEHDVGDSSVCVRVRDDGVGMAKEVLARLFEPFMQVDDSLDRSRGGLGLGLALVKGLVELHGGTVSANSEGLGRGAEFTISFPHGRGR